MRFFLELHDYVIVDSENLRIGPAQYVETDLRVPDYKWSKNHTRLLIDLYGKFKNKVGTFDVKNTKMMWSKIAEALLKLNIHVTPNNCINRWRVLERNYKKYVDNQSKTGKYPPTAYSISFELV